MKTLRFLLFALSFILLINSQKSKAGWGDQPALGQFGQNKLNNQPKGFNNQPKGLNNQPKGFNNQPKGATNQNRNTQTQFNSSTGTIHIRNENVVFVSKIDGSETSGRLDQNGKFVPLNAPAYRGNTGQTNNANDFGLSNNDLMYVKIQYKQLCNCDCQDIILALDTKDPRIVAAACLAAGEYDLDVNERLIDLLGGESDFVSQSARKALMMKSFYMLNKIKRENGEKNIFTLKPNPINLEKFANSNNLDIGRDYVDFGPMQNDDNVAINTSVYRWQAWIKKNESKLSGVKNKKEEKTVDNKKEEKKVRSAK